MGTTTRAALWTSALLALVLLGGLLWWTASERGLTARDLWETVDPPPESCVEQDPTTSGCLTPTALRLHDAAVARFWQGRIWSAGSSDDGDGWGRPYTGGGVYDPEDATGGHFDHVHVSVRDGSRW